MKLSESGVPDSDSPRCQFLLPQEGVEGVLLAGNNSKKLRPKITYFLYNWDVQWSWQTLKLAPREVP